MTSNRQLSDRAIAAIKTLARTSMVSLYSGRDCFGFILNRGRDGFEAFDINEKSLGIFASQKAAAAALEQARASI